MQCNFRYHTKINFSKDKLNVAALTLADGRVLQHRPIFLLQGIGSLVLFHRHSFLKLINRDYIRRVAASNMTGASGHRRVPQYFYEQMPIPNAPQDIIRKIANECDAVDKEVEEAQKGIDRFLKQIGSVINSMQGKPTKISEVCFLNEFSINPNETPEKEYTYVDIDAVDNETGIVSFDKKITGKSAPSRARRLAKDESTLISTVRPNLRGFTYLDSERPDTIYSTGFAIIRSKNTKILLNKLIYLCFRYSQDLMRQMINAMPKGSYPSINQSDINNLILTVPTPARKKSSRKFLTMRLR